jgi:hypothetical protein
MLAIRRVAVACEQFPPPFTTPLRMNSNHTCAVIDERRIKVYPVLDRWHAPNLTY